MFPLTPTIYPLLFFLSFIFAVATITTFPSPIAYYSNTWSGPAQLQQQRRGSSSSPFRAIEAILIIPHLQFPAQPEEFVDQYSASFWVGIDGYGGPSWSGLWQAGVVMHLWGGEEGKREIVPFWEWFPEAEHFLPTEAFPIFEGEHLYIGLNVSTDGTLATAILHNLNTSKSLSHTRPAPMSSTGPIWPVPGASAEWIIESGTYPNSTRMVLPNWGTAVFRDARAYRWDGSVVLPGDQEGLQVFENYGSETRRLYTRTEVEGEEVRIRYVEEECEGCKVECLRVGSCL